MRLIALITVLCGCTGCGTLLSTYFNGLTPYGGVRSDVANIAEVTSDRKRWVTDDDPPALDRFAALQAVGLAVVICDLPVSAVADTFVLPFWLIGYRHVLGWM